MRTEINLVDTVKIAAPCSASWEEMQGDEQKRFCEGCGLHVHNLSAMTRRDAQNLLKTDTDRLCVRYGQRPDGVVVTDNCPPRLRPARALLLKRFTAIASFGLLLFNLTCRTVEAMQRTHTKAAGSKAAEKKKQSKTVHTGGKPVSRVPVILGRRVSHHQTVAPAAPPQRMDVPIPSMPLKEHASGASEAKPPATPSAGTKEAAKDANATVFTLGTGVHF